MSGGSGIWKGQARIFAGSPLSAAKATPTSVPVQVECGAESFTLSMSGAPPITAAYRDVASIVVQPGSALLVLGDADAGVRVALEQFGDRQAGLVRDLRARRTRQRLADRLVQVPDEPMELVEYRAGSAHGAAEMAFQPWALELAPVDEDQPLLHLRRSEIGEVAGSPADGRLAIERRDSAGSPAVELLGLGSAVTRLEQRVTRLRDGAFTDAAALVTGLMPDAPFATRHRLGNMLVDGHPVGDVELGADVELVERAVLTEPTFAEGYRTLVDRGAAQPPGRRWFALAPTSPGEPEARAWFLVALPGNLVALELVSAGAHATYLFRVVPRAEYEGEPPAQLGDRLGTAVREISSALVDARFLREPMALPAVRLAEARYNRYRLALAALPSLADARRRFVARLIHDDPTRWAAALDDLIAWHAGSRDDAEEWPGRAAEESTMPDDGSAPEE